MPEYKKNIMVTGAAGYLASWIVNYLLREGHRVHATVRNLKDREKVKHLERMMEIFPDDLLLYEADLLKPDSFDEAMKSCSVVIHTASPYFLEKPKDIEKELIQPALKGTLNVLASVNKTLSVTRVILTSSVVSLYNNASDIGSDVNHTVQEKDVNRNQNVANNPYAYSKTMAESVARDEQKKQSRWELITLHPAAIFGPSLSQRIDATSVGIIFKLLNGTFRSGVPKLWVGVVDVRNVAQAHVKAAILSDVAGRYIIAGESLRLLEISRLINPEKYGIKNKLPKNEVPKWLTWLIAPWIGLQRNYVTHNVGYPIYFNSSRSKAELGLQYYSSVDTFNDHIQQLVTDKLLPVSIIR
ncbi:NAD-dependent epimerase/dehydratase family protein [Intestinirhabdus alba]|uniref:NAD-dependent epimerase/dehydratase family protein n=1 Tax=Intestinirhabdus alba TaxID=2899544 RepID=A0A6L6II06_9ENTR|nr:NAD-dependent epimerase/dehydratase family protein [Intestinirhabdus alba]MTH45745.1 NAD-dependent epimerase/dehydratase family protein [Intestinirhabdus alba]